MELPALKGGASRKGTILDRVPLTPPQRVGLQGTCRSQKEGGV